MGGLGVRIRWVRTSGPITVSCAIANAAAVGLQATVTGQSAPTAPTITSPSSLVAGTVNTIYPTTTFTATGSTPITWSVTAGTLPTGMTFSTGGVLAGTPTAMASESITFRATNAYGFADRALTLTVSAAGAPVITTRTLPPALESSPYSTTLGATGGGPITWSIVSGNIDPFALNSSTGEITGTPTLVTSKRAVIRASNFSGSESLRLTLLTKGLADPSPTITTGTFFSMSVGASFSQQMQALGKNITWDVTGGSAVLSAAGLSMSSSGLLTGSSLSAASGLVTIRATNPQGSASASIQLNCAAVPQTIPGALLQSNCLTYLGAFALTRESYDENIVGLGRFGFGGTALTFYKDTVSNKNTLFLQGALNYKSGANGLCQIEVPSVLVKSPIYEDLPQATILQKFNDVTGTSLPSGIGGDPVTDPGAIFGVLPFNGKLIIGASCFYSYNQNKSHGVYSSMNIGQGTFSGWYTFVGGGAEASNRAVGGVMSEIPVSWRSALGGSYVTGMQSLSISSTTSCGPSLTVFDPQDIVNGVNPVPGKTLMYYDNTHQICNNGPGACENIGDPMWSGLSKVRGRALVAGTKSILFFGFDGQNPLEYWYGDNPSPTGVFDPVGTGRGPHNTMYTYKTWAFNVNDLVAVKNGTKLVHEVKPYAIWEMPEISNYATVLTVPEGGITHDPVSNRVYLATYYEENPRIEVFQITL